MHRNVTDFAFRSAAVAVCLSTAATLAAPLPAVAAQASPVTISAVLSLSGPYAPVGTQESVALRLAMDEVNRTGGINGRPVRLHVVDDHSTPADAVKNVRAEIRSERPLAVIGGSFESTCTAMRTITNHAHVVQYCLSGTESASDLFFASFPSPARAFGDLPAVWMRAHNMRNVGIIQSADATGEYYTAAFESAAPKQLLRIASVATVASPIDAPAAVQKVLAAQPSILYIGSAAPGTALILRELQARGSRIPVWIVSANATRAGAQSFANYLPPAPVYSAATKLALFENLPANDPQRGLLVRFTKSYAAATGGDMPDIFAAIAADAAEFLVAALRADGARGGVYLARTIERIPRTPGLYAWYHFGRDRHNGTELPGVIVRFSPTGPLRYIATVDDADVPANARIPKRKIRRGNTVVGVSSTVSAR